MIRIHTVKLYPYLGSSVQCSAPCSTGLEQDSQVKNVAQLYSEIHTDKLVEFAVLPSSWVPLVPAPPLSPLQEGFGSLAKGSKRLPIALSLTDIQTDNNKQQPTSALPWTYKLEPNPYQSSAPAGHAH